MCVCVRYSLCVCWTLGNCTLANNYSMSIHSIQDAILRTGETLTHCPQEDKQLVREEMPLEQEIGLVAWPLYHWMLF